MAKSTNNLDLVPQEELDRLSQLNSLLDISKNKLSELIKPIVDISVSLQGLPSDYKTLIDMATKLRKAEEEVGNEFENQKKHYSEIEKLQKRLIDLDSKEAKEAAELREQIREKNNENKNAAKLNLSTSNSVEKLRSRVSALKKEWANMDMNDVRFKPLTEEIKQTTDELVKLEKSIGVAGRYVGNYEEAIKNALGVNQGFASSILNLNEGGEGLKGFFNNAGNSAKAFGKSLLGLMANPVFLVIAGISAAGAAFKFWFDYNKGVEQATRLTKQFTGLSGTEMKQYRNEVQAIADMYNKDFKEVLIASNAVSKQFGIEQSEALKLVKDGFVSGADANGEFLDTLKEYPAYFKEAGVSASQFVAITTQAGQSGIYSDKAIDTIKEGNIRIREMTDATASALDNIGISSAEVQKQLATGATTTFEVMQKVSAKLNQLPADSAVVGTAIADIFGGPGEDAGLQYIRTLATINTDLDSLKSNAGELATIQERQLQSQVELENAISDLFDYTGGAFENLTANAKIFVNDILISLINGIKDTTKWFRSLYDDSMLFRGSIEGIGLAFSTIWETVKLFFKNTATLITSVGKMFGSLFKGDFTGIKEEFNKMWDDIASSSKEYGNKISKDISGAINNTLKGVKKDSFKITSAIEVKTVTERTSSLKPVDKKAAEEARKEAEKRAKELVKNLQKYAEEEKKAAENLESEKYKITADTNKAIVSDTKQSYEARTEALNRYTSDLIASLEKQKDAQINALVRKTQEDLQITGPDAEVKARKAAANQILLIETKATAEIDKVKRESASTQIEIEKDRVDKILQELSREAEARSKQTSSDESSALVDLSKEYSKGLMASELYESQKANIARKYTMKRFDDESNMLKEQLNTVGITAEQREAIENKIANNRLEYEQYINSQEIAAAEELANRKKQLLQDVANLANQLIQQRFENQLKSLEKESEANEEWAEEQKERIEDLEQSGAISKEQAEARKEIIDDKAQAREDELEQKKKEILKKQAIYERAQTLASIIFNTAAAVMAAWKNPLAAPALVPLIIASGAVQTATVLATPIPEYAHGTEDHPGGLAIVGDGGKSEMVLANGRMFKTPSTDTLVDLPQHAVVLPDFAAAMAMQKLPDIPDRKDRIIGLEELTTLMKDSNQKMTTLLKMTERKMKNDRYARELNNVRPVKR